MTDEELKNITIEILKRRNIIAVTSGTSSVVESWRQTAPDRIIPSLSFPLRTEEISGGASLKSPVPDSIRVWHKEKLFSVLGEFAPQYQGISPADSLFEPVLSIAEELDVPLGIHIGPGPPGFPYFVPGAGYRARLHSPLILEEALIRHPDARVYIMHAGWPMLDDTIATLYVHPQVYVDLGVIDWAFPRAEFYRYLRGLVDAGFGKRIMFGSDNMNWPESIEIAIQSIETAPFLSSEQKRDILYDNAARFLRLSREEIDRHHRGQ
jgi:predicted TIM-barrel fold metal-dependent hydrolase